MVPKPIKEDAPDVETTRSQFITKLSTAADAMRKFSAFADSLARVAAKMPLDDPELVETLQAVADAAPAPSRKRKLAGAESAEDGGKKRKREKKVKDPNAPKAPPSAYILFQNEIRNVIREQNPDLQYKDLMQLISKQWSGLPPEKKQPYFDKVNDAKKTHERDLAKYNAQHPDRVADEGPSKKAKKTVEVAEKPAKKASAAKVAKEVPKSAPTVRSSSEESDAESGSEQSSDDKSAAKSEEEDEETSEEEPSSDDDKRPSKKSKKSEKRK